MMKKILGGALVASALLLASCGYTPKEQRFYNACIKQDKGFITGLNKANDLKANNDAKSVCSAFIDIINKKSKEEGISYEKVQNELEERAKELEDRLKK